MSTHKDYTQCCAGMTDAIEGAAPVYPMAFTAMDDSTSSTRPVLSRRGGRSWPIRFCPWCGSKVAP